MLLIRWPIVPYFSTCCKTPWLNHSNWHVYMTAIHRLLSICHQGFYGTQLANIFQSLWFSIISSLQMKKCISKQDLLVYVFIIYVYGCWSDAPVMKSSSLNYIIRNISLPKRCYWTKLCYNLKIIQKIASMALKD